MKHALLCPEYSEVRSHSHIIPAGHVDARGTGILCFSPDDKAEIVGKVSMQCCDFFVAIVSDVKAVFILNHIITKSN